MAFIESHQELARHPKTRRAARLLSVSLPTMIGHLHLLWWWALDFAQDGDLSRYEAEDIADAVLWEGEPAALVDALAQVGFLDRTDAGSLCIHDWMAYAGKLMEQRRANADRQARYRQRHQGEADTSDTDTSRNAHITVTSPSRNGATVQNRTVTVTPVHETSVTASFAAAVADGTAALRLAEPEPKPAGTILTLPVQAAAPDPTPAKKSPSPQLRRAPLPAATSVAAAAGEHKPVNPLWDALVVAFGYEPKTVPERSKWGKVVKDLKAVQATPEQVRERCRNHAALTTAGALHWTLTPTALAAHWGELGQPPKATATANVRASPGAQAPQQTNYAALPRASWDAIEARQGG